MTRSFTYIRVPTLGTTVFVNEVARHIRGNSVFVAEELTNVGSIRKNKIDINLGVELVDKCLKVGLEVTVEVGT